MPQYRPLFESAIGRPLDELRDEFDRLWTSLTAAPPLHGWGVRPGGDVFPAVNVSESDDCLTIEAEVPGLEAGDVDISVSGEELVLKGARPEPRPAVDASDGDGERKPGVTWHRRERGTGGFERRIALPVQVDAGRVAAKLVDGVLTITCPKAPERQPHKVTVQTG